MNPRTVSAAELDESCLTDLFIHEKSLCFFVHQGRCYWVLDHTYNFDLDAEKDYSAYLEKGDITPEQYTRSCEAFRNGVLQLTADTFMQYLNDPQGTAIVCERLEHFFMPSTTSDPKALLARVEAHYLSGVALSREDFCLANVLASRLPLFYINFDREIFLHMNQDRFHESLAHPGWLAKCADFNYLIPDTHRYWARGVDYWKLRFV